MATWCQTLFDVKPKQRLETAQRLSRVHERVELGSTDQALLRTRIPETCPTAYPRDAHRKAVRARTLAPLRRFQVAKMQLEQARSGQMMQIEQTGMQLEAQANQAKLYKQMCARRGAPTGGPLCATVAISKLQLYCRAGPGATSSWQIC